MEHFGSVNQTRFPKMCHVLIRSWAIKCKRIDINRGLCYIECLGFKIFWSSHGWIAYYLNIAWSHNFILIVAILTYFIRQFSTMCYGMIISFSDRGTVRNDAPECCVAFLKIFTLLLLISPLIFWCVFFCLLFSFSFFFFSCFVLRLWTP